jgi:hypothetical protein
MRPPWWLYSIAFLNRLANAGSIAVSIEMPFSVANGRSDFMASCTMGSSATASRRISCVASPCISAYRDTLLALARGDKTIEEVKDFWFHRNDPAQIPYNGGVIKFTPEEAA